MINDAKSPFPSNLPFPHFPIFPDIYYPMALFTPSSKSPVCSVKCFMLALIVFLTSLYNIINTFFFLFTQFFTTIDYILLYPFSYLLSDWLITPPLPLPWAEDIFNGHFVPGIANNIIH